MEYLQANRWKPQQVQDFMPTPMTLASDMHWTGIDPLTGKPVTVVREIEALARAGFAPFQPMTVLFQVDDLEVRRLALRPPQPMAEAAFAVLAECR